MTPHKELTHYAGFDWAKDHHDIIIVDGTGSILTGFRIEHTAAGWKTWREKIAAYPRLGVAIETSFGATVEQLLESGVSVYPVNPVSAKRYRERKSPSGNKTDRHDAWALADALRLDGHAWRALGPQDPVIAELRILCLDEVALIEERTALLNQLQQALHEYHPAALEAFEDWTQRSTWAFVEKFPSADALTRAGKRKWEKFLHTHKLCRPETYDKRLGIFAKAGELKGPAPPWWLPRVFTPQPAAGSCACWKASSTNIGDESKGSLPATLTAACSGRCPAPDRNLAHGFSARSAATETSTGTPVACNAWLAPPL